MDGCFYSRVVETEALLSDDFTGTYVANEHTASPWNSGYQHGGPAAALLARAASKLSVPIKNPLINQVSVDLLAPLPLGAVAVSARIVQEGKLSSLVEAEMSSVVGEQTLMRMSAWITKRRESPLSHSHGAFRAPPPAGSPMHTPSHWDCGYLDAIDWQSVSGGLDLPGPGTVWAEPKVPLVDDEPAYGVPLLLLVADAATGVSSFDDPQELMLINTDLTLHVLREPGVGPIWMSSESWIDHAGIGLTSSVLGDSAGSLAAAHQSVFVVDRESLGFSVDPHPHIQTDL